MNKSLENNLRIMAFPVGSIVAIIIVAIVAGNLVFAKISELLAQNDAAQRSKIVLQEKLSSLQSTQGQVADFATNLTAALPNSNTSLAIASQLKAIALENGITLQNFAVGAEIKEGLISHVDVIFDADGQSQNIFNFVDQTQTLAPINKVKRVKLTSAPNGGNSTANILVSSYWSAFPTQIPAVSDPLQNITAEEQIMLEELSALRQPDFVQLSPETGGGKADPFNSL